MNDLTDVGISDALHAGVGFFGLLRVASVSLPYGWGDHVRGPEEPNIFGLRLPGTRVRRIDRVHDRSLRSIRPSQPSEKYAVLRD